MRSATPRSAPRVVSAHQVRVDSLEPGPHDPGDDQRQRQVPLGAGRAEQRGQAQLHRGRVHGGDVPVRHRGGDRHRLPGRHQPLALQGRLDRIDRLGRQRRQVRQRLMPDLAAVAVGAAHQHRLIHPLLAGLRRIRPPVPGYMHRAAACRHNPDHSVNILRRPERHALFSGYSKTQADEFRHVKAAISTESYSNSGLTHLGGRLRMPVHSREPSGEPSSADIRPHRTCWSVRFISLTRHPDTTRHFDRH